MRKSFRQEISKRLEAYKKSNQNDQNYQLINGINLDHMVELVKNLEESIDRYHEDDKKYLGQSRRVLANFKAPNNDLWQRFLLQGIGWGWETVLDIFVAVL